MTVLFIGLDVHKDTIAVAVAEEGRSGEVRSYGTIPNTPKDVVLLLRRLARKGQQLDCCYEAGPCGYGVYRQICESGHRCTVIAPSKTPIKPGDHIKTDRRDAVMLARLYRAGELEPVWVPDPAHEAMRDLVRARMTAAEQLRRARQQLQAFLLRHRHLYTGKKAWTKTHFRWLAEQKFDHPVHQIVFQDMINAVNNAQECVDNRLKLVKELLPEWSLFPLVKALCAMRGFDVISAATLVSATGDLRRFTHPRQLMSYIGLVPGEHSSGGTTRRLGITKAGNTEVRRLLIQSAWCYRFPARVGPTLVNEFNAEEAQIRKVSWKAQTRLCGRYRKLTARGKRMQLVVTAIARELLAFVWEMGQTVPIPA